MRLTLRGSRRIPPLPAAAVTVPPNVTVSACKVIVGERVPSEFSVLTSPLVIAAEFTNVPVTGVVAVKEIAPPEFTTPPILTAVAAVPEIVPARAVMA